MKSSKVEACFICSEAPCVCFVKSKKALPAKKAEKPKPVVIDLSQSSFHSQERDLVMVNALTILLPDLCPDDQATVEEEIYGNRPSETMRSLTEWRARRAKG